MQPGIEDFLAFEIKKELADRYFGFRKMIEEDQEELVRKVREHSFTLEQKICFELIRIYILLNNEQLIQEFLDLAGLEERMFYDPYFMQSPTIRKRMFAGIKGRGLTRAGRFKNLILDSYETLVGHVEQYREKFGALVEDYETINAEIRLFYKKNDLGNIMGFFRGMDGASLNSGMEGALVAGYDDAMEKKMRLASLPPIDQLLPVVPPLMPLSAIRRDLAKLIDRAYRQWNGQVPDLP
ncbi:MAG: hypothetical protein A2521_13780 [Deltaproteobacteria bacterium RIFOXYD12_FULL_57_12]|nr:MAG: hypothetical protein A2521_13780 [Deltaproteobacteria bacterium RIFOXYD12_FULL_57_12]